MFAIVVMAALSCSAVYARDSRIVNGENAAVGDFPHQLSLQAEIMECDGFKWGNNCFGDLVPSGEYGHICGAVAIDANWAVTAAHCVDGQTSLRLVAGLHYLQNKDTEGKRIVLNTADIIMHESYQQGAGAFPNDIAVIGTPGADMSDYVIALAEANDDFSGQDCTISGWGRLTGGGNLPNALQKTTGKILSNQACASDDHWGSNINPGHICIHDPDTGSCNGDSGGPMTCGSGDKKKLAGVTSWGYNGCNTAFPSVYSKISHFRGWIKEKTGL